MKAAFSHEGVNAGVTQLSPPLWWLIRLGPYVVSVYAVVASLHPTCILTAAKDP
jgi:hypothetical protein